MSNIAFDHAHDFAMAALDDVEFHLPPEPDHSDEKNYKTKDGYKAIVQERWSDDLKLIIVNGKTVDRVSIPF